MKGSVFLIPTPLAHEVLSHTNEWSKDVCTNIKHYFVENVRTARRVLKLYNPSIVIDEIQFELVNNKTEPNINVFNQWINAGYDVGIMSEAGMPAIADPGHILVAKAHEIGAKVVPITGPNSIMLALAASGFNGQAFTFHGYLPIQQPLLNKKCQELEMALQNGYTQIFIETPFRNMSIIQTILDKFHPSIRLCIACDLTSDTEFIKTLSLKEWKSVIKQYDFHKRPAIFLLGGNKS